MIQRLKLRLVACTAVALAAAAVTMGGATAQTKEPIKIGFSMAPDRSAGPPTASRLCSA